MSELEQGNESGASPESPASSESASPVQTPEAAPSHEAAAVPAPKEQPFNEHPRFKEIIAERNQEREQRIKDAQEMAVLREQLKQIQKQQAPKSEKPSFDPVFDRLKGVDPEFADLIKEAYSKAQQTDALQQKIEEMSQWRASSEERQQSEQARNTFEKLCTENKISSEDKRQYMRHVQALSYERNSKPSDLPALFNEVHQELSKYYEARDRAKLEGYVKAKKSDATPATQTGGVPSAAKTAGSKAMTLEDVKAELAQGIRNSGGFHI